MNIEINTRLKISPNEQVFLELLRRGEENKAFEFLKKVEPRTLHVRSLNYLNNLEEKGYLKIDKKTSAITLTSLGKGKKVKTSKEWINDYRELFPAYKKADTRGCLKKMDRFLRDYPEYSQELIMEATSSYIRGEAVKFVSTASNFIEKHGESKLAAFCEELNRRGGFTGDISDRA